MTDEELYEHLCRYVTPERRAAFERVAPWRTRHVTIALENIYQSHNASAVLRSCDLLGVNDVHVIEASHKFDPNSEVALGSSRWLDIHRYGGEGATERCVRHLREKGYRIAVTSPHLKSHTPHDVPIDTPLAVFFGTELTGVSADLLATADLHLRIPMHGFTESYNISVAAAITLFTITERLHAGDDRWRLSPDDLRALKLAWVRRSVRDAEAIERRLRAEAASTDPR